MTLFRTVAISLLLGVIAVRLLAAPAELSREDSLSFVVIGLVYLATLIYGVVLRQREVGPAAAYVQVVGDVALASALVYLTGGAESPFTFTYSLAVVAASILLLERGAFVAAGVSTAAFALLAIAIQAEAIRPPQGSAAIASGRLAFAIVSNGVAQFLIAALASYLARQLSAAGGQLATREAQISTLASLHRQILTCMPSGLITCDSAGEVTFLNRAAAGILGLSEDAQPGKQLELLIPGALRLGAAGGRRNELTVETPHGKRVLGLTVTALEGQPGAALVVFQDLTDLRGMEVALKRADHLAALGKLAAQLAHEIRNPLAAMRGSAQLLAQDGPPDGASGRLTNILVREADRLSALVEDFLRFARPPPPSLRPCGMRALVAETVEMLRADPLARGIAIQLELEDVVAEVDPDQIRQVLLNLLRNAFAAVGPAGRVRVVLDAVDERPRLHVWDSAGSIPRADLERIFEPFFTTREGGTGLGLSTAHSIIQAHGGMIQVTSSPGVGTEFVVGFPQRSEVAVADPGRG